MAVVYLCAYGVLGACAGLLAGLLGVGGGVIIVPVLSFLFTLQHLAPDHVQHLALGTSLASIMFTSVSSLRAHHGRGAVDWQVFRSIAPGIVAGTFLGTRFAAGLRSTSLTWFFVFFSYYVALQLLLDVKPTAARQLPGGGGMAGVGGLIGGVSSLVGIGGGSMTVPFLVWCNVHLRTAIGTSAAVGFPIAVAGAAGYLVNGLPVATLPPYALGFIYLPALAGVSAASILTAPLGAKLAHTLPVPMLKKGFALLVLVMGTKMLVTLI